MLTSQDTTVVRKQTYNQSFGIGNGVTTGYGVMYRYQPKRVGVQTLFSLYNSPNQLLFNSSLTFLFNLSHQKSAVIFLYQSNRFFYNRETIYYTEEGGISDEPTTMQKTTLTTSIDNCLGLGIEVTLLKRIGVSIGSGYGYYKNLTKVHPTIDGAICFKI